MTDRRGGGPTGLTGPAGPAEVDARGLRCPLPVIRLAARAKELAPGSELVVLATDPAARHDVPAWARMRGHHMVGEAHVEQDENGNRTWRLRVRLKDQVDPAS